MVLNLYQALIDELPQGTPLSLGLETAAEYSAPPRIVMIPIRDDYAKSEARRVNSKPLWKRTAAFQVDLWAEGYDTVEGLVEDFLTALDAVAPSALVTSGSWIFDEGWLTAGQAYRIEFSLETFVVTQEQYSTIEHIVNASTTRPDLVALQDAQLADAGVSADAYLDLDCGGNNG